MEIKLIAEKALEKSQKAGAEKSLVQVSLTESKEFNIESNKLTLLRTTFDQGVEVRMLKDQRMSSTRGNQYSDEALSGYVQNAYDSTLASPQDPANGFAPSQGKKHFTHGTEPANEDWMYSKLSELLEERSQNFPKLIIDECTIKFVKTQRVLYTSEGTQFSSEQGSYEGYITFTAKEGKKSSSFNYSSFDIPTSAGGSALRLTDVAGFRDLFRQSCEQIETRKVPQKFDGDLIVTPHCLRGLIGAWSSFLSPGPLIKKSSFFYDKLNQNMAASNFTLTSHSLDGPFASRQFWTADGYLAQDEVLFEKGVLKSYLLNHYGAQKLNQPVSKSSATYVKLASGSSSLQDMIGAVKRGVLLARFSAGMPAENGDVSGVAKNSYYIENGKIQYPISETMVSLNLAQMLRNIQSISKESLNSGSWQLPWVHFTGASVS